MLQFFLAEEVAHLFEHELVLVCRFDRQVAALRVFDEPRSGELHVERFHTRGVSCFPFADRALGRRMGTKWLPRYSRECDSGVGPP